MPRRSLFASFPLLSFALLAACSEDDMPRIDGGTPGFGLDGSLPDAALGDGGTGDGGNGDGSWECGEFGKLDLLFVIDDSSSMRQEQAKLAEQLPKLLEILTSGIPPEGDRFPPVESLHLGVVSTDLGTNGSEERPNSACHGVGKDGKLIRNAVDTMAGCEVNLDVPYLHYDAQDHAASDLETLQHDFTCLANLGIEGCAFEQQLEAMYKALAPNDVAFTGGSGGHGDGFNAGFLRPDAVLAIIQVTDEEDCSVTDEGLTLFDPASSHPGTWLPDSSVELEEPVDAGEGVDAGTMTVVRGTPLGLNIRCAFSDDPSARESQVERAGLIYPTSRYISEFRSTLRKGDTAGVVFAAIVGIPDGTEGMPLDEILAHPRMGFAIDPTNPVQAPDEVRTSARDACRQCVEGIAQEDCEAIVLGSENTSIITSARPAVRFVKVAQGFGAAGIVGSICAPEYWPTLARVVQAVGAELERCVVQ
jgi:hypothetical protein